MVEALATSREVTGSIPDGIIGMFPVFLIFSATICRCGLLSL
jgi:hypothetical protein